MTDQTTACSFCRLDPAQLVMANELAVAVYDTHPVTKGHTLLIPRRHMGSFFEATEAERDALFALLAAMREQLLATHRPDGFNIGINDGIAAGQTVMHLHIHLMPRYLDDTADPRGGVRWIIPDRAPYWKRR
ncbi:MAG TPA: HIT family protein [Geobacteraceae bacterium]